MKGSGSGVMEEEEEGEEYELRRGRGVCMGGRVNGR